MHYDRLDPDRSARRLIKRLQQIGFEVTLKHTLPSSTAVAEDKPPRSESPKRKQVMSANCTDKARTSHANPNPRPLTQLFAGAVRVGVFRVFTHAMLSYTLQILKLQLRQ